MTPQGSSFSLPLHSTTVTLPQSLILSRTTSLSGYRTNWSQGTNLVSGAMPTAEIAEASPLLLCICIRSHGEPGVSYHDHSPCFSQRQLCVPRPSPALLAHLLTIHAWERTLHSGATSEAKGAWCSLSTQVLRGEGRAVPVQPIEALGGVACEYRVPDDVAHLQVVR